MGSPCGPCSAFASALLICDRLLTIRFALFPVSVFPPLTYHLTRSQLGRDLYRAYIDARRHKRSRAYQRAFEADMDARLDALADALYARRYVPQPSSCFIVFDPKQREVFAAEFSDRVVHHLYYNYVAEMMERTFIADSYSCIPHRGTHYGIHRLEQHIRRASLGYSRPCYVLKGDIQGYFIHIERKRLLEITLRLIDTMATHYRSRHTHERWSDCRDIDFLKYLSEVIIMLDPTADCRRLCSADDWRGLPDSKSLFCSPEGCGLPIGNLTSQLFSNVYLGEFDQFAKRDLRCRHYGRYVDDFYVVSHDKAWLEGLVPKFERYLDIVLGLHLSPAKTSVVDAARGVEFLGAFVKPHRTYISHTSLRRMRRKLRALQRYADDYAGESEPLLWQVAYRLSAALNSYCGVLRHWSTYRLRRKLLLEECDFSLYGVFNADVTKFTPCLPPPLERP